MKRVSYFLLLTVLLFGCRDDTITRGKVDEDTIVKYIADHNLIAAATGSGLYYVVDSVGTGVNPNINSQVTVAYKGYFTNGNVFDASNSAGVTFGLNQVIQGWKEGIPLFKKGGTGILLIPSSLAYGSQGTSGIPPNSVIIFDIKLLDIL